LVGAIQIGLTTLIIENPTWDICFKMLETLFMAIKKKSTIVLSNIKMEYMVVANAIKEVIWLQKLTFNFGFSPLQSIPFIVITNHALS
jgi:hypothetical protein